MPGLDELRALHTGLIDARHGYEEAVKDAGRPELKALFARMLDLHADAHRDVHAMIEARGEQPDEAGSFMSTVHETVIGIRAAVVGLERGSLASFASGEEHTVARYDKAIAATASDPGGSATLARHRDALRAMIADMERRADA